MAIIKPFRGYRPAKEYAEKVASFPYDVLNSSEARVIAKDNPYSFLHVVKPEIDLDPDVNVYDDSVYNKGRENLEKLISENILVQDEKKCLYIYQQKMGNHIQLGLVAGASVEDYENDIIKKHEHTRAVKEKDRIRHVDVLNANAGPVFLTYRHQQKVDDIIADFTLKNSPVYDFVSSDGIGHTFWVVKEESVIFELEKLFSQIDYLYVADGHHRSASAAIVGARRRSENRNHVGDEEYNYFLTVLFPDNQLKILDYNRVVKDLNNHSEDEFLALVKESFSIEKKGQAYSPGQKHQLAMYLKGKWFVLTPKEGTWDENDPVNKLDVAILYNNLLHPILAIGDLRTDERIDFVGGIRGLQELELRVDSGEMTVAFAMFPTSIEDLMGIADSGKVMPPKSTWFEPKLRSGLIVHMLED